MRRASWRCVMATRIWSTTSRPRRPILKAAASLMPRSPDPHLGLARIDVYSLKNIGKAMAELHEAQRLGFEPGPREIEEEADGYRFRATAELNEARKNGGQSRGGSALFAAGAARFRSSAAIVRAHRRVFECERRAAAGG